MGTDDRPRAFVPDGFTVPRELVTEEFRLEPLGPGHNAGDYEAWTSSIDHIRATPGFQGGPWPVPGMTLEDNLADLRRHAEDFATLSLDVGYRISPRGEAYLEYRRAHGGAAS